MAFGLFLCLLLSNVTDQTHAFVTTGRVLPTQPSSLALAWPFPTSKRTAQQLPRCVPWGRIRRSSSSTSKIIQRDGGDTMMVMRMERASYADPLAQTRSTLRLLAYQNDIIPCCTPHDEAVLNPILLELNLTPPWTIPEGSARTFNYVLSALVEHYSNNGNSEIVTAVSSTRNLQELPTSMETAATHYNQTVLAELGPRTEKILRYMLREGRQRRPIAPNTVTLNAVLAAYLKSMGRQRHNFSAKDRSTAQKNMKLLHEWHQLYQNGHVAEEADVVSYNTVLSACAKAGLPQQAQELFQELQERYAATGDERWRPDIISYNAVLYALALLGQTDQLGDLFRYMRTEGPAPTIHSYHDVLYAYAKSRHPQHAETFLTWWIMEDRRLQKDRDATKQCPDNDDSQVRPTPQSYNIVLYALSRVQRPDAMARAQKLFRTMPMRDAISYTTLIAALCQQLGSSNNSSGGGGKNKNNSGGGGKTASYSSSRTASTSSSRTTVSSSVALGAVQRLLEQAWHDDSTKMIAVDASFVSNVLYSLATIRDDPAMPAFAESYVQECISRNVVLDIRVYNALIHCWAKSNVRDNGERVLELLARLEQDPDLLPDVQTYTNVLDAFKNGRGSEHVAAGEAIVETMERSGPVPTVATYTALIMMYARSRLPNKAVLAASVLERMKRQQLKHAKFQIAPNLISYNAVLNACEHTLASSDRIVLEECLKVACSTFDKVRSSSPSIQANHVTYASFLGTLTNLLPPETRQELVALVFRRCCNAGQASPLVLKKLSYAAGTEDQFRLLLQGHAETQLPANWTCHVRDALARQL
jgi:pentatricopeptide repeat protein